MYLLLLTCVAFGTQAPTTDTLRYELRGTCAPTEERLRLDAQDRVWATVLDSLYSRTGQAVLLVADSTEAPPRFGLGDATGLAAFETMGAELEPSLSADFLARNAEKGSVDVTHLTALGVRVPLASVSRTERADATIDPATGLHRFKRHPGAGIVVSLSRVGFSPDARQALVHVVFSCGPRCGNTQLVLLTRERDEKWRVSRTEQGISF